LSDCLQDFDDATRLARVCGEFAADKDLETLKARVAGYRYTKDPTAEQDPKMVAKQAAGAKKFADRIQEIIDLIELPPGWEAAVDEKGAPTGEYHYYEILPPGWTKRRGCYYNGKKYISHKPEGGIPAKRNAPNRTLISEETTRDRPKLRRRRLFRYTLSQRRRLMAAKTPMLRLLEEIRIANGL